jgi:ATP-binding protein involved in chromosome partitioning
MPVTQEEALEALRGVEDPQLYRNVVELGMVRAVRVVGDRVDVLLALPSDAYPQRDELGRRVAGALSLRAGVGRVASDFVVMTGDEQAALVDRIHGRPAATAGTRPAHGHAEGRAVPFADPGSRTRVLLVSSGKGGVGKSSVTVNLSVALARRGLRVAVVDADVWGFSIPPMLGIERPPMLVDRMVVPPEAHGVRVASIGFFVREDQPVIWRGPMLHKALEQFLTDFYWGEPDYLVVDLPPGTGDVSLSLASFLPRAEAYVVTTPQPAAQRVAQRAGLMFQTEHIRIPVRGVVENMSWFTGDDGRRYQLFGAGGGRFLAERLGVPLLGQIPLVPALREGGDVGRPIVVAEPDGEAARAFHALAEAIDVDLAPKRRYHPRLKIV